MDYLLGHGIVIDNAHSLQSEKENCRHQRCSEFIVVTPESRLKTNIEVIHVRFYHTDF